MYKNFVLQNKELDFDGGHFSKQKDFWQDFKEYRLSKEYLELCRKNKENSQKSDESSSSRLSWLRQKDARI